MAVRKMFTVSKDAYLKEEVCQRQARNKKRAGKIA